jgi:hypothetical protein
MKVEFEYTAQDYRTGLALLYGANAWSRWTYRLMSLAGILLSLLGVFALTQRVETFRIAILILGLALTLMKPLNLLGASAVFRNQPLLQGRITLGALAEGLEWKSAIYDSKLLWPCYSNWAENKDMLIVISGSGFFNMVPKRAFASENEVCEFRGLLSKNITFTKS